jgi:hypothetical protein
MRAMGVMSVAFALWTRRGRGRSPAPLAGFGFLLVATLIGGVVPGAAQTAPAASAQVHVRYEASQKFAAARDMLQRHKVLEKAQVFMSPLRLPRELTIRAAECGALSVPYDGERGVITICYEAVANVEQLAKAASSDPEVLTILVSAGVIEEALHRMAEAILKVFDVPVWGKQADAADRLAAFIMLKFDERTARVTISGAAQLLAYRSSALGTIDYAAEVSPAAQRFYNFLCIAYGGDRIDFQGFVDKGLLPKFRANRCWKDYESIRKAFDLRLMPYVDPDLVVKVRATDWLHDGMD